MKVTELHQCHKGEYCLIVGCGESAYLANEMPGLPRIAVNDACVIGDSEYQVCVNQIQQYTEQQKTIIKNNRGIAFFTAQNWKDTQTPVFRINLKKDYAYHFDTTRNKLYIPYGKTSVYVALYLAKFLGFTTCGLVGYDFTPKRIVPSAKSDLLESDKIYCDNELKILYQKLGEKGFIFYNLSTKSRLSPMFQRDWEEFYSYANYTMETIRKEG